MLLNHAAKIQNMRSNKFQKRRVTDFENNQCSGCGLCVDLCPRKCISMGTDSWGFRRPMINDELCVDCGLCAKQCIIDSPVATVPPIKTYAAVRSDSEKISLSSSGGVFAAIAESLISEGWLIAGCILDSNLNPCHILTADKDVLNRMYGSKYVQSDTNNICKSVKEALDAGNRVLFSGTPCQVAAIKRYTNNNQNLLTIEVICHGVPSAEMFHSSLKLYKKNNNIKDFLFRDKGQGWTFNNLIVYDNGQVKKVNHRLSSYMTYFLEGETYRDSCYKCPYAKPERCADITIGDFWGVVSERPDLKKYIDIKKGVSCLIVNTEKGEKTVEPIAINKFEVLYNDIKLGNEPLNHASVHTEKRNIILGIWKNTHSWTGIDKYWKKHDYKFSYLVWSIVPVSIQHKIRLILGKR